jgi:Domain of unknown function (DUF4287)
MAGQHLSVGHQNRPQISLTTLTHVRYIGATSKESSMSFQAYLDAVETKTGKTPRQLIAEAHAQGFGPDTKSAPILAWLAETYGLGRGHGMAIAHVITNGPAIPDKHVGSEGTHADASAELWLDGKATRPA